MSSRQFRAIIIAQKTNMQPIAEPAILGFLQTASIIAAGFIGFTGVLIMCYGTIKGIFSFVVFSRRKYELITEIRIDVAKHLSLGLEFLVGKDIIETIIRPTLDQLLVLAFIIGIRTVLAFILSWEMRSAVKELTVEGKFEDLLDQQENKRLKQEIVERSKK